MLLGRKLGAPTQTETGCTLTDTALTHILLPMCYPTLTFLPTPMDRSMPPLYPVQSVVERPPVTCSAFHKTNDNEPPPPVLCRSAGHPARPPLVSKPRSRFPPNQIAFLPARWLRGFLQPIKIQPENRTCPSISSHLTHTTTDIS